MLETHLEQVKRLSDSARSMKQAHTDACELRDSRIGAAYLDGAGEAELMGASGLVQSHIQKICLRAQLEQQQAQREALMLEPGRINDGPAAGGRRRR